MQRTFPFALYSYLGSFVYEGRRMRLILPRYFEGGVFQQLSR